MPCEYNKNGNSMFERFGNSQFLILDEIIEYLIGLNNFFIPQRSTQGVFYASETERENIRVKETLQKEDDFRIGCP